MIRLLYLVSHPIQYQAPLLRKLACRPGIALRVVFIDTASTEGGFDPGFQRQVAWDVPLRSGYDSVGLSETSLEDEIGRADAVWLHGWQGMVMRRAMRLAKGKGRPVLMRGENWDGAMPDGAGPMGLIRKVYRRWLLSHCDAFLAIGSANRDFYLRRGILPQSVFSVPYAVDNAFFMQRAADADLVALRTELGLPMDRQVVLYSGKFMPRKHPHTLLKAWQSLADKPVLLFVGSGELEAQLRAMAGDDPLIHFLGFRNQTELPGLYALADVFVLASEREPWGLAVNEAMACATAVVVSDQCGAAFDLVDDTVGAVVPAGRADALALALKDVLTNSAERGRQAQRRVAGWGFDADIAGIEAALAFLGVGR